MKVRSSTLGIAALTVFAFAACSSSSSTSTPTDDGGGNDSPASSDAGGSDSRVPGDGGVNSDSPNPGNDATADSPNPGDDGSTDSPPSDVTADARDCGNPGDPGNSMGVGKYCMTSGDCPSTAPFCSDLGDPTTHFCTKICTMADSGVECGENATCECGNGGCGCTPNTCL